METNMKVKWKVREYRELRNLNQVTIMGVYSHKYGFPNIITEFEVP